MLLRKYHGLGNDYFIMRPVDGEPSEELTRRICNRNTGAGSDGILVGPYCPDSPVFRRIAASLRPPVSASGCLCALRILNPDGSEAEKSGNGLRIFAQYLRDEGIIGSSPVSLLTLGGVVTATVHENETRIEIGMGPVTFDRDAIPVVTASSGDVVDMPLVVGGSEYRVSCASVGNPHCVVPLEEVSRETACRLGPLLEVDGHFPNRTNVQFLKVLDRHTIQIEIWERGAGYTLASGSSSSAAAAVAVRRGMVESPVTVVMPGGRLDISIDSAWNVVLTGPACHICDVIWPGDATWGAEA